MNRIRARWVFTGDQPPLPYATIEVADGVIQSIESGCSFDIDLDDVAIIPGLINTHTHLEFSELQRPLEPLNDFTAWIRSVIQYRREHAGQLASSIQTGLAQSLNAGVTSIGEIATENWDELDELTEATAQTGRVVMFREFLGLNEDAIPSLLDAAEQFLTSNRQRGFTKGLSPHAPYSVHPKLLAGLCDLAKKYQAPLAMHLAESPAEIEFLEHARGPFFEMLDSLGVLRPELVKPGRRPLDILKELDCDIPVLVVHGNYLSDVDIDYLSGREKMSVAYCPRTHHAMQTHSHPWLKMLEAGINVTLGTDSRASNPDLSIWNELAFLHRRHPQFAASELLKLSTSNAARALGLQNVGTLKPGHCADLTIVQLAPQSVLKPEQFLFDPSNQIINVMKSGHWTSAAASEN